MNRRIAIIAASALVSACASGQSAVPPTATPARPDTTTARVAASPMRPLPYPIVEPRGVARAVEAETRTRTGEPGPKYWQQYSRYRISAEYAPATGRLDGQVTITYINRSPNRIPNVFLHLYHNLFAENAMRNRTVPITGGVTVSRMAIGGQAVQPFAQANPRGYRINGTIMGGAYPDVDRANNVWPAK